jgi:site-specific DNA-methyltransferase (adenine-specific)
MAYTLYQGDCLEILKGLADNSVDFICGDPPYGILKHRIETQIDIAEYFRQCYRVLKKDCFNMYFGRQPTLTTWNSEAFKLFAYKQEIIWYKRQRSSPMNDMGRVFENIMVTMKGFRKINQVARPYTDVKDSLSEFTHVGSISKSFNSVMQPYKDRLSYDNALAYLNGENSVLNLNLGKHKNNALSSICSDIDIYDSDIKWVDRVLNGIKPQNLISFMSHNKQRHDMSGNGGGDNNLKHPTVKPVNMLEYLILLCTNEGDTVLDPFMGTGTTGIACANTGRNFIGMELDPEYFVLSQERITKANMGDKGEIIAPDPLPTRKPKLQIEMF